MCKINYGRVILGGIVAGIIAGFLDWFLNGFLMGQHWENAVKSLNRPNAYHGPFIYSLYLGYMVGGILLIWLYAAIRPRFGGVRTALYTGLVVWALAGLLPDITNAVTGIFSPRLMLYFTFTHIVGIAVALAGGPRSTRKPNRLLFTRQPPARIPCANGYLSASLLPYGCPETSGHLSHSAAIVARSRPSTSGISPKS